MFISCNLLHFPQCCFPQISASLPSREMVSALGRWDRKFLLCSCPAVGDLTQLLETRSLGISAICFHAPCWSPGSPYLRIFPALRLFPFSCLNSWPPVFPESEGIVSFVIASTVSSVWAFRIHHFCSHLMICIPKSWGLICITLSWVVRHGWRKCLGPEEGQSNLILGP